MYGISVCSISKGPFTVFVANDAGYFKAEMAPVTVKTKKG